MKESDLKIFIGNAEMIGKRTNVTINITELLKHKRYFRKDVSTGIEYTDVTLIPFKEGKNKFNKTHYAIIRTRYNPKQDNNG